MEKAIQWAYYAAEDASFGDSTVFLKRVQKPAAEIAKSAVLNMDSQARVQTSYKRKTWEYKIVSDRSEQKNQA